MPICKCCKPLQAALGGSDQAYGCSNSTPTVEGKKFSIQNSGVSYCRIDMDLLMDNTETKCDYAFAKCPPTQKKKKENTDLPNEYKTWYFVELAGDSKDLEHCYKQLKASIIHFRKNKAIQNATQNLNLTGYIIGGKTNGRRRTKNNKSDLVRKLKSQFVEREKLGKVLRIEKNPKFILSVD